MTEKNAIEKILAIPKLKVAPSLGRIRKLLGLLGNPQQDMKFVHVAGTNGKGSISTMISSALGAAGVKCGLFTSPYVDDFKERFIIDGKMVSADEFTDFAEAVFFAAGEDEYSQFEIITAIGVLIFAHEKCEVVVLECGLGGRFDATNVIEAPLVSVIGQIGYDHMQILGDTIEKIAAEKSKIIKSGSRAVILSPQTYPKAAAVIEGQAFSAGVRLVRPDAAQAHIISSDSRQLVFAYKGEQYTSSLAAHYQLGNCICAIEALWVLASECGLPVDGKSIKEGLATAYIPARLETICISPRVILDGAHNRDGMRALNSSLRGIGDIRKSKIQIIIGMLAEKEPGLALDELFAGDLNIVDVVTVTPPDPRAMPAHQLMELVAERVNPARVRLREAQSLSEGLRCLLTSARGGESIICCGSLYIMGSLRRAMFEFCNSQKTDFVLNMDRRRLR